MTAKHCTEQRPYLSVLPLLCQHVISALQALDSGVGQLVDALKSAGLYDNSILVFSTDNGGTANASNYPLKGKKEQVYEGGVRGVGFVHSPLIEKPGMENNKLDNFKNSFSQNLSLG